MSEEINADIIIESLRHWKGLKPDFAIGRETDLGCVLNLDNADICHLWLWMWEAFCSNSIQHPNELSYSHWETVGDVIDTVLMCQEKVAKL